MTLPQRHLSQTVQTAVSVHLASHIYAAVPANRGEGSGVTGRSRTYSSCRVEFQREFACRWLGLCMLAQDGQFEATCAVFKWRWIQIQVGKFGGGCCRGDRRQAKPTPDDQDAHVPRPLMGVRFYAYRKSVISSLESDVFPTDSLPLLLLSIIQQRTSLAKPLNPN